MLQKSKCSIFHNIFKSIQNLTLILKSKGDWLRRFSFYLTLIFLIFFQCCLKTENDVMI